MDGDLKGLFALITVRTISIRNGNWFYCWLYCSIAARLKTEEIYLRAKNGKCCSLLPLQAYHYHFSNDRARLPVKCSRLFSEFLSCLSLLFTSIPPETFVNTGQRKHQIRSCTGSEEINHWWVRRLITATVWHPMRLVMSFLSDA